MTRENQRIRDHHVFPPPRREHDDLGNVVWRQGIHPLIDLLRSILIAVKPHDAKLRLHLSWIDLNDSDAVRDMFAAERLGEGSHGCFGGAVDTTIDIWFSARDGADVYDVAAGGLSCFVDGEDGLRHVYQTRDVGCEHDVYVFGFDVRSLVVALYEATTIECTISIPLYVAQATIVGNSRIVDQDINLLELLRQAPHETADLLWLAHIQLHGQYFNILRDVADFLCNSLQCVYPPRRQDEFKIIRACTREL